MLPTLGAVFNFESLTLDNGYGIANFTVLYLLGRYLRLHHNPTKSATFYFLVYFCLMATCGAFQVAYSWIMGFEFTTLISYDTFFVFFGAVALFCAFSRLEFKNHIINYLATSCFAVYIIHIHPWVGSWTFETLLGLKHLSDTAFIVSLLFVPIITYLVCFCMDQCRVTLFKMISALRPKKKLTTN